MLSSPSAKPELHEEVPLVERLEGGKYGDSRLEIQLITIEMHVSCYRVRLRRVVLVLSSS